MSTPNPILTPATTPRPATLTLKEVGEICGYRTDNAIREWLARHGVTPEATTAYRKWPRHLVERAAAGLPMPEAARGAWHPTIKTRPLRRQGGAR